MMGETFKVPVPIAGRSSQWLSVSEPEPYHFWTSPASIACAVLLTLGLLRNDCILLNVAFFVVIYKIASVAGRWITYLLDNPRLRETLDINTGYFRMAKEYVMAFLDIDGEHRSFRKQLIAGSLLYYRTTQVHCLALYFRQRQEKMVEGALSGR
ncbi:expressed unknown protein [Seminavis robusta]|uniref:Uncharacterized protein n=1 Tax=Seminavis robusta TaxID=568900 RepID=A0A9N8E2I2_9STRA|nr:expressed unknown protein [Seminavis robusta]|eukprot:Sro552_g165181.1  (154) ;mRNA; f:56896-57357